MSFWFAKQKELVIDSIEPISRRHAAEVIQIDRQSNPWLRDEAYLFDFLAHHNCGAIIGTRSGMVISFALFQYRQTVIQLTLKVHHHYRRGGAGLSMVDYLKNRLDNCRRPQLLALVADWNLDAHLFFRAMEFHATGVISKNHFADGSDRYSFRYRKES